jgi:hypothetical protein
MSLRYFAPLKKPKAPKWGLREPSLIRSDKHLKYVRGLHCVDPLCESREIEAAHLSDAPKSERGGTGIKASDVCVVPMCRELHRRAHQVGHETVEREVMPPGVTLLEYALKGVAPNSPDPRIRDRAKELTRNE